MGLWEKFCHLMGVDVPGEEEDDIIDVGPQEVSEKERKSNLVSIPGAKNMKVVIFEPNSYDDEVRAIADCLRNRKQVVLNLEKTPADTARRILDFISGTTYVLDGHSQKLAENIFLFVPSNVEIMKDARVMLRSPYTFGKAEDRARTEW